jgi:hypothetical protein
VERTYHGEPKLENFIQRCTNWYLGLGQYSHRTGQTEAPINISILPVKLLDRYEPWYRAAKARIQKLAVGRPSLDNYPPGHLDDDSPYKPFFLLSPVYWQSIIFDKKMEIRAEHQQRRGVFSIGPRP